MSNYIEFGDKIAFHPGYYINEILEEKELRPCDFAMMLDISQNELDGIIGGKQKLSIDIAAKLSNTLGTSIGYWLNLQHSYDTLLSGLCAEGISAESD